MIGKGVITDTILRFWDASKKANLQQCMLRVFSVCGFEYVRV